MPTETTASRKTAEQLAAAKQELREHSRAARRDRSARRLDEASHQIAEHLMRLPQFEEARCASVYVSRPTEPGTAPLLAALSSRGTRVLLPMLGDGLQRGWGEYRDADDLIERAPGRPPEPSSEFLPGGELERADVIVVPALGVDFTGTRLGQGGGWYDRALAQARPDALIVAAVFESEWFGGPEAALPREAHDIPVHAAVTPRGLRLACAA